MTPRDVLVTLLAILVGFLGGSIMLVVLIYLEDRRLRLRREFRARPHRVRILRHSVELFMPPNVKGTAAPSWIWRGR